MKSKFWIIVRDTYRKNVKTPSFIIMMLAPLILGLFIYAVTLIVMNSEESTGKVALVTDSKEVETVFKKLDTTVEYQVLDEKTALKQLRSEEIGSILKIAVSENGTITSELTSSQKSVEPLQKMTIQQTLTAIQQQIRASMYHLKGEQVAQLLEPATLKEAHIEFDADGKTTTTKDYSSLRSGIAVAIVVLIYMFVMIYGSIIAQEIANEKGTRIMEVILSSVKAKVHFYGKLLGVLCMCLTNVAFYALLAVLAFFVLKNQEEFQPILSSLELDKAFTGTFWLVIPIVILGILLFTVLSALSGSLITRVEDVPKAQIPVTMVGVVGYILTVSFQTNPGNIVMNIASYVPFVSTFVLPMQIANGLAGGVKVFLSLTIMLATTIGLLFFSAKLYRNNVLQYGSGGFFQQLRLSVKNLYQEKK